MRQHEVEDVVVLLPVVLRSGGIVAGADGHSMTQPLSTTHHMQICAIDLECALAMAATLGFVHGQPCPTQAYGHGLTKPSTV